MEKKETFALLPFGWGFHSEHVKVEIVLTQNPQIAV